MVFYCGHCAECHSGHVNLCFTSEAMRGADEPPRLSKDGQAVASFMNMGAFAEQVLVHESGVVAIRRDMPFDRACLISCGVATGFGAAV
ncbi:alcohol dehydrogenase catalytic domain-containing protein, partial [Pseudomonas fragariae (ex Marin et al. 2024)]|uniref:alcohol dehydrogenase catalytic domain-containing protein n=1 Tax=Pseudomonas fragariae (ex Marin et al. 2024) TaxID=3080056 RepID=UPI003CFE6B29